LHRFFQGQARDFAGALPNAFFEVPKVLAAGADAFPKLALQPRYPAG
jgi:hypothetical protein